MIQQESIRFQVENDPVYVRWVDEARDFNQTFVHPEDVPQIDHAPPPTHNFVADYDVNTIINAHHNTQTHGHHNFFPPGTHINTDHPTFHTDQSNTATWNLYTSPPFGNISNPSFTDIPMSEPALNQNVKYSNATACAGGWIIDISSDSEPVLESPFDDDVEAEAEYDSQDFDDAQEDLASQENDYVDENSGDSTFGVDNANNSISFDLQVDNDCKANSGVLMPAASFSGVAGPTSPLGPNSKINTNLGLCLPSTEIDVSPPINNEPQDQSLPAPVLVFVDLQNVDLAEAHRSMVRKQREFTSKSCLVPVSSCTNDAQRSSGEHVKVASLAQPASSLSLINVGKHDVRIRLNSSLYLRETSIPLKKRKALSDPSLGVVPDHALLSKEHAAVYLSCLSQDSRKKVKSGNLSP